ncbi:MAG: SCO family protein [Acidimicrobiales bacterium]
MRGLRIIAPAVVALGLTTVAACGESRSTGAAPPDSAADSPTTADTGGLTGFVRTPAPVVGELSLPDVTARAAPFPFRADEDGLLLVYFGYTSCPDVCPTTLADIRYALSLLDASLAERVEVAMATIDPDRDTDRVITDYLRSFIPDAHPLRTTDEAALRAAADGFGADYQVATTADGAVEVLHTGSLYAVDDEGRLVVTWPFGTRGADLATDMETLLGDVT